MVASHLSCCRKHHQRRTAYQPHVCNFSTSAHISSTCTCLALDKSPETKIIPKHHRCCSCICIPVKYCHIHGQIFYPFSCHRMDQLGNRVQKTRQNPVAGRK